MNNILRKSIIFLLSLFASWVLLYFVISEVIIRFMQSSVTLSLIIMFVIAFVFYISAITIIDKKFNKLHIDTIAILYFLIVIGLTFFKSSYNVAYFNLNPLNMLHDFKDYFHQTLLLLVCNLFIYIPLGIYVSYKTRIRAFKLLFGFLLYIFVIELIQVISHRGIFDINDIITNTFGFYIGTLCNNIMKNFKDNLKIDDTY